MKYPRIFKSAVDMLKVNFDVIRRWIETIMNEQLPEDDIIIDYLCELLKADDHPNIRAIHTQMRDFLGDEEATKFCEKLWGHLLSAQEDKDGIPRELIEERIQQQKQRQMERDKRASKETPASPPQTSERGEGRRTNYNRVESTNYNRRDRRDREDHHSDYRHRRDHQDYRRDGRNRGGHSRGERFSCPYRQDGDAYRDRDPERRY